MTNRKRVCIVQEYVPSYRAPLFNRMRALVQEEDFSLELIAGAPQRSQASRGDLSDFKLDAIMRQREFSALGHRITFRDARRLTRHADLVIMEQARRNLDLYVDLALRPSRVALWGHGSDRVQDAGRLRGALLRSVTNRARWFFGYTPTSVASVVAGGFDPKTTTALWNTTDTATLRAELLDVSSAETARFRESASGLALFVGAFDESKRLRFLVSAGERVAARNPGFRLVLCGDGPQREELRQLEGARPWLRVLPRVTGHELAVALASSDAIAMPGRVGLVAVDSLISAVPLVTVEWPFHAPEADYLNASNSVRSRDSLPDYARALEETIFDDSRNQTLRSGARGSSDLLTIEGMAERFVSGIRSALRTAS